MGSNSRGKFGKDKHFELTKKALIHVIDKYWETFGIIQVENATITMDAHLSSGLMFTLGADAVRGQYDLHPDITVSIKEKYPDSRTVDKIIIVECETSPRGLLEDEMRLTAYKLLRLRIQDKNKLMMYIALPSEFKGKAEKPESFNDLWFFDVGAGFDDC